MNYLFDSQEKTLKEIDGRRKRSLIKRVHYADAPLKNGHDAEGIIEMLRLNSSILFTTTITYGMTGIVICAGTDNDGLDTCSDCIEAQCNRVNKYFLFDAAECSSSQTMFYGSLIAKDELLSLFRELHINAALKTLK